MQEINIEQYYSSRGYNLTKPQTSFKCPFHEDKEPSMSISKSTGLWMCFGCKEHGNIVQFESKLKGLTTSDAYKNLCAEFGIESEFKTSADTTYNVASKVEEFHKALIENNKALAQLESTRGIKIDIVKKYKLGFDSYHQRIVIPLTVNGVYTNLRKYKSNVKQGESKYIGVTDHNSPALFPFDNLKEDKIYLMEGEMDCLLAIQLGLPAITVTGGAGSWNDAWTMYFADKEVVICYDIDEAGRKGSQKVINKLKGTAKSIKNIELPIKDPPNGDFTDYIIKHEFTIEDFNQLVKSTPTIENVVQELVPSCTSLSGSSNSAFYGKYIEVPVTIAGKDDDGYLVPHLIKVKCTPSGSKKCVCCPYKEIKEAIIKIEKNDENILGLFEVNDFQLTGALRKIAKIPCDRATIEVIEKQSIEELVVIPEITYTTGDSDYVAKKIYYTGHGIKSNKSYLLRGFAYTHPKDQRATILVNKAIATQGNLDPNIITEEMKESFKIFHCDGNDKNAIRAKLKEIYNDLSCNITKIFDRNDLHLAIDLCYHSVINFNFCGTYINKGWTDILVVGDSRCGKSITMLGLLNHYKAGEIVSGDNVSFSGLVGGVQQIGKGWNVTWGKLVLNNGRLVAIDELKKMEPDEIAQLTNIRSSGIAEVNKIKSARTVARTRFICFSNPASTRQMNTYSKGVLAIQELMKQPENISRFDFAMIVANDEVEETKINSYMNKQVDHKYTSKVCHDLVLWAWTRNNQTVVFDEGVEKLIMEKSLLLTAEYDSSIPLVVPAEQRIKLSRLAIALATRLNSTDSLGDKVVVMKGHVEFLYDFLKETYNKPSMAYDLYSMVRNKPEKFISENYDILKNEFKTVFNTTMEPDNWKKLKDLLLEYEVIRKAEVELYMKWDNDTIKIFFDFVLKNRLMFSIHNGYAKHPLFIKMLKDIEKESNVKKEVNINNDHDHIVGKAKEIFGGKNDMFNT